MTKTELYAYWERWMHRNDLTADLDTVYASAAQLVNESLISIASPDIDAILANSPRPLQHAGLVYLHQLAQDNDGMSRELSMFREAITDYALRTSINNVVPQMSRPYYQESE